MKDSPYLLIGKEYEGSKIKRVNMNVNAAKVDGYGVREYILVELESGDWVRYYLEDLWIKK